MRSPDSQAYMVMFEEAATAISGCRFPHKLKGQDGENGCFGGALGGSAAHELYFLLAARDFTNDPINTSMR